MLSSGHMLPIGHERWLEEVAVLVLVLVLVEVAVLVTIVAKGGSASADSWWLDSSGWWHEDNGIGGGSLMVTWFWYWRYGIVLEE